MELNGGHTLTQIQEKLENLKLEDCNYCRRSDRYAASARHHPDLSKYDRKVEVR